MKLTETLIELNETDKERLGQVIKARWRKHRKTVLISFCLPLLFGGIPALLLVLYRNETYTASEKTSLFLNAITFLSYPVVALVIIANIILLFTRFYNLYSDKRNNKKRRIPFHPEPYCIPELKKFYVRTGIKEHPFFPVPIDVYQWINSSQVLFLEMTPKSKILFDVKDEDELEVADNSIMLQEV